MDGSNETIVCCLAGNLCSPRVFDKIQFSPLAKKVYYDYLNQASTGHVDKIAEELITWIREKAWKKVVLAGYSAGGVIALAAASKAPELFQGLILSNTGLCAEGNSKNNFPQELQLHGKERNFLKSFLDSCFLLLPPQEMENLLVKYALQAPLEKAVEVSISLRQVDYSSAISCFHGSVLILWGKKDRRRTEVALRRLERCIPQAETFLLDAGHTPMWDAAKGYQTRCREFLQKIGK